MGAGAGTGQGSAAPRGKEARLAGITKMEEGRGKGRVRRGREQERTTENGGLVR